MWRQLESLLEESMDDAVHRERTAFDAAAAPFGSRLVLFGAGGFGRSVLGGLQSIGIEPLAFADNNPALWGRTAGGVQVLPLAEAAQAYGANAVFLITIWNGQAKDRMADRISQLRGLGCTHPVPAGLFFWKYPEVFLPRYAMDLPHHVLEAADQVRRAYHLLTDNASRREYLAQTAWRLHLDFDRLTAPTPADHYFPPLFRLSPREVLVDCGAFDGDTIQAFLRRQPSELTSILAFEPDSLNWSRLQAMLAGLPDAVRTRIAAYPQAVSSMSGTIRFDATGTDLSSMGAGSSTVECVALDAALDGIVPTMIKFDIEGAEPDALEGARGTIAWNAPILAVSAYHRQSHLWEIPIAIAGIRAGYRYALRAHGAEGWDVVCYAIPPERWSA